MATLREPIYNPDTDRPVSQVACELCLWGVRVTWPGSGNLTFVPNSQIAQVDELEAVP